MPGNINDWPLIQEYDDALRDRRRSFNDADIQYGNLLEVHSGMPMHLNAGGSPHVCVYRVGDWVVRCFVSNPPKKVEPPPDIITRYEKITAYIKQRQRADALQFLVPCELVNPGINIQGKYFPYLKIPYMSNCRSLGDFLTEHYHDRSTIELLAKTWLDLIHKMEDHHLAHGDLDLSNVLVHGGFPTLRLYLIDFDGMYIPEFGMTNMTLTDRGHTHFQPSQPNVRRFDSTMDHFSALVIYLSLCALERNSDLWDQCEASDRNLLLHDEDFQRLAQSKHFPLLRNEQQNKPLQLCLNELEKSISQRKMPRSLNEILQDVPVPIENPYVPASGSYEGRPPVIPIEESATANTPYTASPYGMASPSYSSTPSSPYAQPGWTNNTGSGTPTPTGRTSSSRSSGVKVWLIAIIVIVIIIGIIILANLR